LSETDSSKHGFCYHRAHCLIRAVVVFKPKLQYLAKTDLSKPWLFSICTGFLKQIWQLLIMKVPCLCISTYECLGVTTC